MMSPILQRVAGRIAVTVALMFEGALIFATGLGLTTTAEDAENLPRLVQWLIGTPVWVSAVFIPLALLGFAAWVFRPDQVTLNAMRDYKASNDRAWAFEPEFRDHMGELKQVTERLNGAFEERLKDLAERRPDPIARALAVLHVSERLRGRLEGLVPSFDSQWEEFEKLARDKSGNANLDPYKDRRFFISPDIGMWMPPMPRDQWPPEDYSEISDLLEGLSEHRAKIVKQKYYLYQVSKFRVNRAIDAYANAVQSHHTELYDAARGKLFD